MVRWREGSESGRLARGEMEGDGRENTDEGVEVKLEVRVEVRWR